MDKLTALSRLNSWWQKSTVDKSLLYRVVRSEFKDIVGSLERNRILSIVGPRRVGKSTLIYQTIDYLLKKGIDPSRVLFFNGDDPVLFNDCTIGDILEMYAMDIIHENFAELAQPVYIFIDEIHVVKDWQVWLKSYYDRKHKIKFIVSGSSSIHLFHGSKESLMGRIESLNIMPLTFTQFCSFWAVYKDDEKIKQFKLEMPEGSVFEGLRDYYQALYDTKWKLDSYKPYVNKVLKEYLFAGGYPEYFVIDDNVLWQKRLVEDIIGQGLYRDIISVYNIKNPPRLEKLLYFIAENNGQDFNYKTIADTIGCDNETVSNYISYLSQAFLAVVLENYSTNIGKTIRKNKKLYILDNGIGNALLHIDTAGQAREGRLIETLCVRDSLSACQRNFWRLNYWRDGGKEIDIIIDKNTSLMPVEAKYRNDARAVEIIRAFADTFGNKNIREALIVTKDKLQRNDYIFYVPYWLLQ